MLIYPCHCDLKDHCTAAVFHFLKLPVQPFKFMGEPDTHFDDVISKVYRVIYRNGILIVQCAAWAIALFGKVIRLALHFYCVFKDD